MQTTTTTSTKELQDEILSFIAAGAQTADGALQERTYARLHHVIQNHFDGSPNQYSRERMDWRIMQRFFAHIFTQGEARARMGEELYAEMAYILDPPPVKMSPNPSTESPKAVRE